MRVTDDIGQTPCSFVYIILFLHLSHARIFLDILVLKKAWKLFLS